jgi:dihydrofolate reductase
MITLILAHDEAGGIGLGNGLPWPRIPEDMKLFRDTTSGHTVVMGRKTYDTLGNPLPNRTNIVVSNTKTPIGRGCGYTVIDGDGFADLLNRFKCAPGEIFIIGGAQIYELALPFANRIMLTRVCGTYEADTFWKPELRGWTLTFSEHVTKDNRVICVFETYRRKSSLPAS